MQASVRNEALSVCHDIVRQKLITSERSFRIGDSVLPPNSISRFSLTSSDKLAIPIPSEGISLLHRQRRSVGDSWYSEGSDAALDQSQPVRVLGLGHAWRRASRQRENHLPALAVEALIGGTDSRGESLACLERA